MKCTHIPVHVVTVHHQKPTTFLYSVTSDVPIEVLNQPPDTEVLELTLNIMDELATVRFTGKKAREMLAKINKHFPQAG